MLIVGGVDIGNRKDIGVRMIEAIQSSDVIVAENLNRFNKLCDDLGISTSAQLIEYYAPMEPAKELEIILDVIDHLHKDRSVLLLTDDGMPGIADPGGRLIHMAHDVGLKVTVIPGPSIVSTLPSVLGVDSRRFTFEDELPSDRSERLQLLQKLRSEGRGVVFIVKNRRDENTNFKSVLKDIYLVFPPENKIGVGLNLTMPNEMIVLSSVADMCSNLDHYSFTQNDFISVYIECR
jgi:16S rRNA (cytidine1402-2'-O)-methyltransferase